MGGCPGSSQGWDPVAGCGSLVPALPPLPEPLHVGWGLCVPATLILVCRGHRGGRQWGHRCWHVSPALLLLQIFENKGEMMGCSNPHPHCQVRLPPRRSPYGTKPLGYATANPPCSGVPPSRCPSCPLSFGDRPLLPLVALPTWWQHGPADEQGLGFSLGGGVSPEFPGGIFWGL